MPDPTCPDCTRPLAAIDAGAAVAHRCDRCRGLWLDPVALRRLSEEEARPADEVTALAPSQGTGARTRPRTAEERVRYRACPRCGDVMNRTNFGKVSGVVIDVCRPHGAWLDRGELAAIRRFLREGGLNRYERLRRHEEDRTRGARSGAPRPPPPQPSLDDLYDVLAGGDSGWDLPPRVPRLLVAACFGALGAWSLWRAFHPRHFDRTLGAGPVLLGIVFFYFAWRALQQWASRRGR